MPIGTVKWFDDTKGFGYIIPDDGTAEVFVHMSSIKSAGFKTLKEGQQVQYEEKQGPKGKIATAVHTL